MEKNTKTLFATSMTRLGVVDIRIYQLCRRPTGVSMVKGQYIKIVLFTIFVFFSTLSSAQEIKDSQVIVIKSNEYGLVFDAKIHHSSGILDFYKIDATGKHYPITNFKDLIDYMDLHGYDLSKSIRLASVGDVDGYIYTLYVFIKTGKGDYPQLTI